MDLYTKKGKPLQISGSTLYSRSYRLLARMTFGHTGRYVGSIVTAPRIALELAIPSRQRHLGHNKQDQRYGAINQKNLIKKIEALGIV